MPPSRTRVNRPISGSERIGPPASRDKPKGLEVELEKQHVEGYHNRIAYFGRVLSGVSVDKIDGPLDGSPPPTRLVGVYEHGDFVLHRYVGVCVNSGWVGSFLRKETGLRSKSPEEKGQRKPSSCSRRNVRDSSVRRSCGLPFRLIWWYCWVAPPLYVHRRGMALHER